MEALRKAHRNFVAKPEPNGPVGRLWRGWKDRVKFDLWKRFGVDKFMSQ
jgi:hypothetical protein